MPLLKQLIANHFLQLYNFFQENSGVFGYSITDLTSTHQEKTLSRASHHHRKEFEKQLKNMLRNGIIELSVVP